MRHINHRCDVCRTSPGCEMSALKRFDKLMRHGPKQFSWFIYRVTDPTMRKRAANIRAEPDRLTTG
jgi:hypothetical protein